MERMNLEYELIRKFNDRFQARALNPIQEAYEKAGVGFGQRIRKLAEIPPQASFKESILAFHKFLADRLNLHGDILEIDESFAHICWKPPCFIGLDEAHLCDMVAVIDGACISGLSNRKVTCEVVRSVAKGADVCELKYHAK